MHQLHKFLKVFIFVQLGSSSARIIAKYIHYVKHPEIYASYSAPWYTDIVITAVLTAITVILTAIAYFIVGHIISKNKKE